MQNSWNLPDESFFDQQYRSIASNNNRPILETFSYFEDNPENAAQIYWGKINLLGGSLNAAWLITSKDDNTVYFYSDEVTDSPMSVQKWYALPNSLNTQPSEVVQVTNVTSQFVSGLYFYYFLDL